MSIKFQSYDIHNLDCYKTELHAPSYPLTAHKLLVTDITFTTYMLICYCNGRTN